MCGIAGGVVRGEIAPALVEAFKAALHHRGPDGNRHIARDGVLLVHTRLSIIDLAGGAQPITAADGVALVANGEIYNDPELRARLDPADFATGSDCESALHLYRKVGEFFASELRGMFAIAIHDPGKRRLILARDPFGIKPLYYAETPRGFYFASEPQALVRAGVVGAGVDPCARGELLAFNFSIGSQTVFAGIHRVSPGETIVVEDGRIVRRLNCPALPDGGLRGEDDGTELQHFTEVWRNTVAVHQRSDVPYGMFLSGGINSAAVLAMMSRLNDKPILAFTAAFPGTDAHDEREEARAAACAAGAEHIEIEVYAQDFWSTLPAIADALDDPVVDYAAVPTFLLAQAAARDVKVVLSGEGGDELFAGYGRTRAALRPWPFAKRPWRRHRLAGFKGLRVVSPSWRDGMADAEKAAQQRFGPGLRALQALDSATWLPNDLLLKVDRCLMAHGVEGRVPFLDPEVAEFAFRLSDRQKIRGGQGKWLLRQWLVENFPAARAFAKKRGFTVPVAAWIAAEGQRLGPLVARQPGIAEICEPGSVEALFSGIDGKNGGAAWTLLFYALWHRRHIMVAPKDGNVFEQLAQ